MHHTERLRPQSAVGGELSGAAAARAGAAVAGAKDGDGIVAKKS